MSLIIILCKETDWFDPVPLGMQDGMIVDSQIAASSSKYFLSGASNARLNLTETTYGGWIAADQDSDPWLQVNFISNVTVTGIATQGLEDGQHWVNNYTVVFGYDRDSLNDYKVNGAIKVHSKENSFIKNI